MMWMQHFCFALLLIFLSFINCPKIDELRATITEEDQRAFIKCHVLLGDSASVVYRLIQKFARSKALSRSTVYLIYQQFSGGDRTESGSTARRGGPGKPRTQATRINKQRLRELLLKDDELTIDEMATTLDLSHTTIQRLLKDLNAKFLASRWLPHELNTAQMQTRVEMCQKNLDIYQKNSGLLDKVIAIDESWLRSYDAKDPKSAKKWCLPEQDP